MQGFCTWWYVPLALWAYISYLLNRNLTHTLKWHLNEKAPKTYCKCLIICIRHHFAMMRLKWRIILRLRHFFLRQKGAVALALGSVDSTTLGTTSHLWEARNRIESHFRPTARPQQPMWAEAPVLGAALNCLRSESEIQELHHQGIRLGKMHQSQNYKFCMILLIWAIHQTHGDTK
jgi:hypothetical protein